MICNVAWRVISGQGAEDTRSDEEEYGKDAPRQHLMPRLWIGWSNVSLSTAEPVCRGGSPESDIDSITFGDAAVDAQPVGRCARSLAVRPKLFDQG